MPSDKIQNLPGKCLRLLDMRQMTGIIDQLEARARHGSAIAPAVIRRYDPILRAPEKQCWNADTMQAMAKFGIVHVGRPGKPRELLAIARRRQKVGLRHGFVVLCADAWFRKRRCIEL